MKRSSKVSIGLACVGALLPLGGGAQVGNWSTNRNDAGRAGVQKIESSITRESLASDFKFLWKLKLGEEAGGFRSYSEPLLIFRLINSKGFKDYVIWSDRQNIYAVDSELGQMLWRKHAEGTAAGCAASNLAMTMEPPVVINFAARRPAGTKAAPVRPMQEEPVAVSQRRVGMASVGGGYFGLKGIYWLAPDGMLHEQVVTTGADFAPPVKYLPGAVGVSKGLGMSGRQIYTTTAAGCAGAKNALYVVNMASESYPVKSYDSKGVPLLTTMSPTLSDDAAVVVTGAGASDAAAGVHANSVVAVAPDATVKGWYEAGGALRGMTPAAFTFKGRKLVAAPGKGGGLVLLDAEKPGGEDHRTVLAEAPLAAGKAGAEPDALAAWQDASSGAMWLFATVHGAVAAKAAAGSGAVSHGAVVAYKVEEADGRFTLSPQWVSGDMTNPAPPVVVQGMVVVLAQGSVKTPARLLVLDAADGKQLYTSGSQIPTYASMAGVSVGDGHVFFVTHDNTLYSFGIGIEH